MKYQSKSIKTVFSNHLGEIYKYCERPSQFKDLTKKIDELLGCDELKGNQSVAEAKQIFDSCKSNYNRYISTLMTYITGIKVS